MHPEPTELQILRQILGHERGGDVFALYTMAGSIAQHAQQVAEQAQKIEQLQTAIDQAPSVPPPPVANHWTGTNGHAPIDAIDADEPVPLEVP